jgi:DNA-binding Xre family transcriptional regulator
MIKHESMTDRLAGMNKNESIIVIIKHIKRNKAGGAVPQKSAKAEMSTTELKEKSGVGGNTISKIMNNETVVRPAILGKLAKALNITVEELL